MLPASVNLIPEAPVVDIVRLAQLAERLGYTRCWVYDEGLLTRDVYVTLTAIAQGTSTIEIGPGITNPYTRHPSQTAAAIASIDELSGGRAFLGIGAGGSITLGPLGISRAKPLVAVREMIEACRGLFSATAQNLDGETTVLRNATLSFARPDTQIWLAGRGPRMLDLGGRVADGVMLDFIHAQTMGDYVAVVAAGAAAAGRPTPKLTYSTMVLTDGESLDEVRPHMTYRLVDSPPMVRRLLGLTDDDIGRIRSAMAHGLQTAAQEVRDEWVLPFIVHGSTARCRTQIATLMRQHGFDEFMLPVLEISRAEQQMAIVADVLG